jgi:hypothetical protein
MDKLPTLLLLAALATLAFASAPATAAQQLPSGCTGTGVGDHDGDGYDEASGSCTTPPCGCNCPAAGAGVELIAANQDASATVIVGCGYYIAYGVDLSPPDLLGPVTVDPALYCYGGGLGDCRLDFVALG